MKLLPEENKLAFVSIRTLLFCAFVSSLYGSIQYTQDLRTLVDASVSINPAILVLYETPQIAVYLIVAPAIFCVLAYLIYSNQYTN